MPGDPAKRKRHARNPERTRESILRAAFQEFSSKGLAGARVDVVARRAGVNKRMIYHYFTGKQALFREVIRGRMTDRTRWIAAAPEDPALMAHYWYSRMWNDLDWIRLLEWEALEFGENDIIAEETRHEVFQGALKRISQGQRNGLIAPAWDPAQVLLSIMAITSFPVAFPQLTKMVTGFSVTSEEFHQRRLKFLEDFVSAFRPSSLSGRVPNKRNRENLNEIVKI